MRELEEMEFQREYRYIMTGEAVDELTEKLQEAVEAGRRNEIWRTEYMKQSKVPGIQLLRSPYQKQ